MGISIDEIIKKLTLDEKIGMIHGAGFFTTKAVERLGIPALKMADGPGGVRNEFPDSSWIPIGLNDDFVSYLPSNTAITCTWNRELAHYAGQVLGEEARGRGKDVILAPGINIHRSPLCGRNFEYMSEDPFLTSELSVPLIQGIQENDVAACVKHFALNNQETKRMVVESIVDDRTLHEIYLPAFYTAVKIAKSYSIMGAYNCFRGEHCCESRFLLDTILKKKWNYDGVVISDWGGVHHTKEAAESSLDIEMSVTTDFDDYFMANPLKKEIEDGNIKESCIDEKVKRILTLMNKIHLFDPDRKAGTYNTKEHHDKLEQIAEESIVLLKNESSHLPLQKKSCKKIAVIGDNANRKQANGGGSSEIKALYEITPLLGLHMILGGNSEIIYHPGYYVDNEKNVLGEVDWQAKSLQIDYSLDGENKRLIEKIMSTRKKYLNEAVKLAKECDEVVFIGGLNHAFDVEGFDRENMTLPYDQDTVIQALLDINPNTTVVIIAGSPVDTFAWRDNVHSLLYTSYNGMNGGYALARTLFGEVNPSGRLMDTFPCNLKDSPAHCLGEFPGKETDNLYSVKYDEGIYVGYRYYTTKQVPTAFPFGYGLSYTNFEYSDLKVQKNKEYDCIISISCKIKNTGEVDGKEVVQLYLSNLTKNADHPTIELKGFEKITLNHGEEKIVTFSLSPNYFSYYDCGNGYFRADQGEYMISIGSSSEALKLQTKVELDRDYIELKSPF